MAQVFLSLPLPPSGLGPGAAVAIPACSPHKTFLVAGDWQDRAVLLEISADGGTKWNQVGSFLSRQQPPQQTSFSALHARVNVKRLLAGNPSPSGTPVVHLAIDTVTGATSAVAVTIDGAAADVSALENKHKTFVVGADADNILGAVVVEGSNDGGASWNALFTAQGPGTGRPYTFDGQLDFVRARSIRPPTSDMSVHVVADPFECQPPAAGCSAPTFAGVQPGTFTAGSPLAVARTTPAAAITQVGGDSRSLVMSGVDGGGIFQTTVDEHDLNAGAGTLTSVPVGQLPPAATAADGQPLAVTLANCKVLCFLGFPVGEGGGVGVKVFEYDPVPDTWTQKTSNFTMELGARGGAVLLTSGLVLVTGAFSGAAANQAALYDPVLDAWTATGPWPVAYQIVDIGEYGVTKMSDGKVLLSGGSTSVGMGATNLAILYDPGANTWSSVAAMNSVRAVHTATLLPSGKVLAAGGVVAFGAATATADVYDPVANSWTLTGTTMNVARRSHTAHGLPNGKVFVVGGFDTGTSLPVGPSEIFDEGLGWQAAGLPSLITARFNHASVMLPDATQFTIVVGGGFNFGAGGVLSSVEFLWLP